MAAPICRCSRATASRASVGAQISHDLRGGNRAFPGAHQGAPYRRVLADAQYNARSVENPEQDETISLLSQIADRVRGAATLTRPPVDLDRLERETVGEEPSGEARAAQ